MKIIWNHMESASRASLRREGSQSVVEVVNIELRRSRRTNSIRRTRGILIWIQWVQLRTSLPHAPRARIPVVCTNLGTSKSNFLNFLHCFLIINYKSHMKNNDFWYNFSDCIDFIFLQNFKKCFEQFSGFCR